MFTTRQTDTHTVRIYQLAKQEKSYKRQILSLVGTLHHAAKVVYHGKTFVSRMYATAAKVKELDYYQTEHGVSFRSIVVAHFPHYMEWS